MMGGPPAMPNIPQVPKAPGAAQASASVPGPAAQSSSQVGHVGAVSGALPPSAVDDSSPEAFIRGIAPYAMRVSRSTGIPAEVLIGMAANETGFGKYAHGNNLFGIK